MSTIRNGTTKKVDRNSAVWRLRNSVQTFGRTSLKRHFMHGTTMVRHHFVVTRQKDGTKTDRMEAQFLQSQSDRLAALRLRENARRLEESACRAVSAEALLETRWTEWKSRLEALLENDDTKRVAAVGHPPHASENERRTLQLVFNELQEILNSQRRQVSLNDALSDASLMRWHKLLVAGQGQLDKIRANLLPKNKFVFRRYRQAMTEREQQANNDSNCADRVDSKVVETEKAAKSPMSDDLVNYLQDLSNGKIEIRDKSIEFCPSDTNERQKIDCVDGNVPMVWRRLQQCCITWRSDDDKEKSMTGGAVLHLVDLTDCQLNIGMYLSSIHLTDCQSVSLRVSQTQQVRLHTSEHVQVWGRVTGGTIMEECRKIGVTVNCPSVQDFSWLKTGRPSPNLERLSEPPSPEKNASTSTEPMVVRSATNQSNPAQSTIVPANESLDDDEL